MLNCTWVSGRDRVTEGELATYVLLSVRLSVRLCVCCVDVLRDRVVICCCFFVILFCPCECRYPLLLFVSCWTEGEFSVFMFFASYINCTLYGQAINVLSCVSVICITLCELSCCVMQCGACVCVCSCGGGGVFMWPVCSCGGVHDM